MLRNVPETKERHNQMSGKARIRVASLAKAYSGTVTSFDDLVAGLDPDRFEAIFILLRSPGGALTWMEKSHKVFCLFPHRDIRGFRLSSLLRLVHILRSNQVEILHCHNHKANLYGVLASLLARTPVTLVQFHGLSRVRTLWRRIANVLVLRRANRVLAVSDAVQQDILATNWSVPAGKLFLLEDSVDYERFAHCGISKEEGKRVLGVPREATVFGAIGRLVPTKGQRYLIDAFCHVREQVPSAHLVLIGDGNERNDLEQQAAATPHSRAIHFLGYRNHIERCIRGMDLFVLSSVAEGAGRVLLEAMAAGVPCVGTAVGGIPEVLAQGRFGRLAPPRDAQALAQAMLDMAAMPPPQRQNLIEQAQARVRTLYSHDVVRTKLATLYEQEFTAWKEKNA